MNKSGRIVTLLMAVLLSCLGFCDTMISEAKVIEAQADGLILEVNKEPLRVAVDKNTRFWKVKRKVDLNEVRADDKVSVRIKTDVDPPLLREIADLETSKWLEKVRKEVRRGSVIEYDGKYLHVKLDTGDNFAYRATPKTAVSLGGLAGREIKDLKANSIVYLKGRLLPNLDTWLAEVSDRPLKAAVRNDKDTDKPAAPAPVRLPAQGTVKGTVLATFPKLKMIDIRVDGQKLTFTFNAESKILLSGATTSFEAVTNGLNGTLTYKRDKAGRLVVSKAEFASPTSG